MNITYLDQPSAAQVDVDLVTYGYSIPQLMELAGLACATAIWDLTKSGMKSSLPAKDYHSILVLVGPGNNGGDGLVLARHLAMWGYQVELIYPKRKVLRDEDGQKHPYELLLDLCLSSGCRLIDDIDHYISKQQLAMASLDNPSHNSPEATHALEPITIPSIVVDCIFGFSFKCDVTQSIDGNIRHPFTSLIRYLATISQHRKETISAPSSPKDNAPILVCVDIPSGWDVEQGDVLQTGVVPNVLISLTAPKQCATTYTHGVHVLAGRFIPQPLQEKYQLGPMVGLYSGSNQYVILSDVEQDKVCPSSLF